MKPERLSPNIRDLVGIASNNRCRHPYRWIGILQRSSCRYHGNRFRGGGADLPRPERDRQRKVCREALRDRHGREQRLDQRRRHKPAYEGRDCIAEHISENWDCRRREDDRILAKGRKIVARDEDEAAKCVWMPDAIGCRDHGAPGMSYDDRLGDAQLCECGMDQIRLRVRGPRLSSWPVAVTEAGAIERDDTIVGRRPFGHATSPPVLVRHAVSVQKHQCGPVASGIGVMKPDPIDRQEFALGRMRILCKASCLPDEKGCSYGRTRKKKRGRQS